MAGRSSGLSEPGLSANDVRTLLSVASRSIRHGLDTGQPFEPATERFSAALRQLGATFVTLEIDDELRGCVGTPDARLPIVEDVAYNAFSAAFRDPRFAAVRLEEVEQLSVQISVLSPSDPIPANSEDELLSSLRPGVDGLILEQAPYRALFLPRVWRSVDDRRHFVTLLKRKAGLPDSYWSPGIRFRRFTVEELDGSFTVEGLGSG